jgi:hypothetical protein
MTLLHCCIHTIGMNLTPHIDQQCRYWRSSETNKTRCTKILTACQAATPVDLHFEFKVDHQSRGRGKPSHTDLMAISDTVCVAIEAKWTEPPYENIASWLSKGGDNFNREEVLKGWLALMSLERSPLSSNEVADCEYQMLHRAASACGTASAAKKGPILAYFKFTSPSMPPSAEGAGCTPSAS